jgi:N-acetylmuramoyl-L-alanine amidase
VKGAAQPVSSMSGFKPDSTLVSAVRASPNHGERKDAKRPDAIILHYTGMQTGAAAIARLCEPTSEVSSHYVVEEDGTILQLVPEARRAWHAGKSYWAGERDLNSTSIGIEIVNGGHDFGLPAFPDAQIAAVIALCTDISARRKILPSRILAHSDIAPGRKQDPGERFPWDGLAAAGVGHYVVPTPLGEDAPLALGASGKEVETLQEMLAAFGFEVAVTGEYDKPTEQIVSAFQRHFRPVRIDGKADRSTIATLRALLHSRPRASGA